MATLQFKGKSAVWNYHLSVPYHTLDNDTKKSLKGTGQSENLIVHGDNLLALKSLLPKYQSGIKCIYIDPPYNTGNENWIYNDNANSPTTRDWVGKVVGKQGEDLTRHDKWLCMMTPRLKILKDLLSDDGLLFVSIDDYEQHHLRMLLNEIFDESNFVCQFVWQKAAGSQNDSDNVATTHEYVLCYAKNIGQCYIYNLPPTEAMLKSYNLEDEFVRTRGKHTLRNLDDFSIGDRPGLHYDITCPDGTILKGKEHRWRCDQDRYQWRTKEKRIVFEKSEGGWQVFYKQYINEKKEEIIQDTKGNILSYGKIPDTLLLKIALTGDGKRELKELFGESPFPYPKPVDFLKHLLKISTKNHDIILDSFAGSGTTAHAILNLNEDDDGERKFILVETEDYANKTTAERIRRVIKKNKYKAGFTYSTLGPAIDAETILSGKLPTYAAFAKYVFYLATGKNHPKEKQIKENQYFVGKTDQVSIYLIYKKDLDSLKGLAITLDWAHKVHANDRGKKIVYAPACYLDEDTLEQLNIQFVSIPYNLFERKS